MFRSQAIEEQKHSLYGDVVVLPAYSHTRVGIVLILIFIAMIFLLVFGKYPRVETVSGWLEPPAGLQKIYSARVGYVSQLLVSEFDVITAGQVLAVVNLDTHYKNGDSLAQGKLHTLNWQRENLQVQAEQAEKIFQYEEQAASSESDTLQTDLNLLTELLSNLDEQRAITRANYVRARSLNRRGALSAQELENNRLQLLTTEREYSTAQREALAQESRLNKNGTDANTRKANYALQKSRQQEQLHLIGSEIRQLESTSSYAIIAPISGIVSNLQVRPGTHISDRTPVMVVLPMEAELEAQLLVPVRANGFVEPGQTVSIRYDAYPFEKFGSFDGTVLQISQSISLPREIPGLPIEISEPVYYVKVGLEKQAIPAFNRESPLKAGMTLKADIILEERSIMEWLFEPLIALRGRI